MRLIVSTPLRIVLDLGTVQSVRAEDDTGWFGILDGHADFLTVLVPSVVIVRTVSGQDHFVAVRGGVLTVSGGTEIQLASPDAVAGTDLDVLEQEVLRTFHDQAEQERQTRSDTARLQVSAIRHAQAFAQAGRPGPAAGGG